MKKKKFILILLGTLLLLVINNPFVFSANDGETNIDWVCIGKPSCVSVLTSCNFQPVSIIKTKLAWIIVRGYPKVSFEHPLYIGKLAHNLFLCTSLIGEDADSQPLLEVLYIETKGKITD